MYYPMNTLRGINIEKRAKLHFITEKEMDTVIIFLFDKVDISLDNICLEGVIWER